MQVQNLINNYFESLNEKKAVELKWLHQFINETFPDCKKWFFDGKDDIGKIVTNPQIGYGNHFIHYANGSTKEFYQVGISANLKGISVYIMGLDDKKHLTEMYGNTIGKAKVTGYCIKFKTLKDVNLEVLQKVILEGFI